MYCERLGDLLQWSDSVMAVSLMPQTQGLIRRRELRLMKPTAILINICRGLLVDQDALVEALQTGLTKAASLNVTFPESLPRDHPLLELKNVTLTPPGEVQLIPQDGQMMENLVERILASFSGPPVPKEVLLK